MNEASNMGGSDPKVCGCHHHKVVPLAILLIGVAVLLGSFGMIVGQTVNISVAVLLIVIGGVKLASTRCKCC
jgi:hypothetical protein